MKIQTTKDYSKFKSIDGNRNKNLLHINRLKKSMQQNYLFTIIVVNEKFEIIDGQHRFEVIKELGLPLNYVICEGYSLNEVHTLNQNSVTWKSEDYLDGYCKLGYKDYILYKEFKNKYKIGHYECMWLLNGTQLNNPTQVFFCGQFKVKNYKEAVRVIELLKTIEPYYSEWKRRSFILTMLQLLRKETFVFSEFIDKLKIQPSSLVNCSTNSQYLKLIEEIYNYRRRLKVNLRF
jgi:hypothetical protein